MTTFETSPHGIEAIISRGESDTVEFKSPRASQERLAQHLTALANSEGGILILGVMSDRKIVGVPSAEVGKWITRLRAIARSTLFSPTEVDSVMIRGRHVIYAVVEKAPPEYYPLFTSRGEFYKRIGGKTKRVNTDELISLRSEARPLPQNQSPALLFVAMSFREEEDAALIDYFEAIKRAAADTQYPINVRRMDLVEGDFEISQKIMDEIDKAHIVLADFTLNSHNVYFELGYARGVKKRVIQTARKGTATQFDIRNWRTVFYRNATELHEKLVPELSSAYADIAREQ